MDERARAALHQLAATHVAEQLPEPSPVVVVPALLSGDDHDALLDALIAAEPNYVSNAIAGRRALVLPEPPAEIGALLDAVVGRFDELARAIGLDPADVTPPTADQLLCSAHGHGDFLGPHNDIVDPGATGSADETRAEGQRILTFVYHLHRLPPGFSGGELRLYDRWMVGGRPKAAPSFVDFASTDNMLIAYLPSSRHEVVTVRSPARSFADRRFAIAGFGMWEPA